MPEPTEAKPMDQPHNQRSPHDDTNSPRDLKVKIKEQQLIIDWKDGKHSEFSLDDLRKQCPCAACRTDRDKKNENPFNILKADPTTIRVTSAKLVGNYAIQFNWSDGHNTGIFDFRFLHELAKKL